MGRISGGHQHGGHDGDGHCGRDGGAAPPIAVSISRAHVRAAAARRRSARPSPASPWAVQRSDVSVLELGGERWTPRVIHGACDRGHVSRAGPQRGGSVQERHSERDRVHGRDLATDSEDDLEPGLNAGRRDSQPHHDLPTLSPSGGTILAPSRRLNGCPADQVVKAQRRHVQHQRQWAVLQDVDCTLRGSGTGTPGSGAGGTRLIKATGPPIRATRSSTSSRSVPVLLSINLASDAVKGSNSVTLVSNPGIQVGEIVLIDHNTNNDRRSSGAEPRTGREVAPRRLVRSSGSIAQPDDGGERGQGTTITFATPFTSPSRPCTRRSSRAMRNPFSTGPESRTSISNGGQAAIGTATR